MSAHPLFSFPQLIFYSMVPEEQAWFPKRELMIVLRPSFPLIPITPESLFRQPILESLDQNTPRYQGIWAPFIHI